MRSLIRLTFKRTTRLPGNSNGIIPLLDVRYILRCAEGTNVRGRGVAFGQRKDFGPYVMSFQNALLRNIHWENVWSLSQKFILTNNIKEV